MSSFQLDDMVPSDFGWVVDLGNANQQETGPLDRDRLAAMVGECLTARVVRPEQGFMLTFCETAIYDSPNFRWFQAMYRDFVYVDRIVVAAAARGQGVARQLYEDLFATARTLGQSRVVAEVNADPPNPVSDAFHAALGFVPVGTAQLANGKIVTYLARDLTGAST